MKVCQQLFVPSPDSLIVEVPLTLTNDDNVTVRGREIASSSKSHNYASSIKGGKEHFNLLKNMLVSVRKREKFCWGIYGIFLAVNAYKAFSQ